MLRRLSARGRSDFRRRGRRSRASGESEGADRQDLPKSEEDKIVEGAEKDEAKSADWAFDIGNDDPGVMRSAGTPEHSKRDLQLSMEALAETRRGPERSTKPSITLGSDDRLPLKGTVEKGQ